MAALKVPSVPDETVMSSLVKPTTASLNVKVRVAGVVDPATKLSAEARMVTVGPLVSIAITAAAAVVLELPAVSVSCAVRLWLPSLKVALVMMMRPAAMSSLVSTTD